MEGYSSVSTYYDKALSPHSGKFISKLPRLTIEGFDFPVRSLEPITQMELNTDSILSFVNQLSDLVDNRKESLPEGVWDSLRQTLDRLMIEFENGRLYEFLLEKHGPDALNISAWRHFARSTVWDVGLRVYRDIPADLLLQHGATIRRTIIWTDELEAIVRSISRRTDNLGMLSEEMIQELVLRKA